MALSVIVMRLRADLRATLGDVAVAHAVGGAQLRQPVLGVERMHLERGHVDEEPRADELVLLVVIAQHVADVLAQKALDTLAEFLHAVDIRLLHAPGAVRRVRRPRLERLDLLLDLVVPGHIGHEVFDVRKRPHRLDGHRLIERQLVQPRHAHEARIPVDLGRTRAALAGLAVPAARQIGGLRRLDGVDGVEHDHAFADLGGEVLELPLAPGPSPDAERRGGHGYLFSSMTCLSSSGSGGIGTCVTFIAPSAPFSSTMLNVPSAFDLGRVVFAEVGAAALLPVDRGAARWLRRRSAGCSSQSAVCQP